MQVRPLFLVAAAIATSACSYDVFSGVALYPVCEGEALGSGKVLPVERSAYGTEAGQGHVCIDTRMRLEFRSGELQIYPYKNRPTEIHFACEAESSSFYAVNVGRKVALLADDRVVAIYGVLAPATQKECGVVAAPNFETALSVCDAAAKSWDKATGVCNNICENEGEIMQKKICSVARMSKK